MKKRMLIYLSLGLIILKLLAVLFIVNPPTHDISKIFNLHGKVVEKGIYSEEKAVIEKFKTIQKQNPNQEIYFVLGNEKEITLLTYEEILKEGVSLDNKRKMNIDKEENLVYIIVNKEKYEFELNSQENIYMIIKDE